MQELIKNLIKEALKNLGIKAENIVLEHPADIANGDYSTNVAFFYLRDVPKDKFPENVKFNNPKEFAEKIIEKLNKNLPKEIEKIKVAGAGFINFYLPREFFTNATKEILKSKENWGK